MTTKAPESRLRVEITMASLEPRFGRVVDVHEDGVEQSIGVGRGVWADPLEKISLDQGTTRIIEQAAGHRHEATTVPIEDGGQQFDDHQLLDIRKVEDRRRRVSQSKAPHQDTRPLVPTHFQCQSGQSSFAGIDRAGHQEFVANLDLVHKLIRYGRGLASAQTQFTQGGELKVQLFKP